MIGRAESRIVHAAFLILTGNAKYQFLCIRGLFQAIDRGSPFSRIARRIGLSEKEPDDDSQANQQQGYGEQVRRWGHDFGAWKMILNVKKP